MHHFENPYLPQKCFLRTPRARGKSARKGISGAITMSLALLGFLGLTSLPRTAYSQLAQSAPNIKASSEDLLIGADRLSEAFRNASRILKPSVVTITTLAEQTPRQMRMERGFGDGFGGFDDLEPFRNMIPEELLDQLRGAERSQRMPRRGQNDDRESEQESVKKVQTGMGSGVIVSNDGYILTNNHVVSRADELQVELSDGRTFNAKVIGTDSKSDVAVLKIDADNLVAARMGDSSAMQVGDWVIAVGSPFGLDQTVTAGIISATNRQASIISNGYEDFLQTDAAINPGNSGGPLVNLRGEVIGINTAINSRTGTNAGVGFAIPANMAVRIMEDLRNNGRVVRGFIGASLAELTAETAKDYGLPNGLFRGAVIQRLLRDGPAERGALQPGDVVTAVDGRPVTSVDALRNMVALSRPGAKLKINIYREGIPMTLPVVVGELTDDKMNELAGRVEVPDLGIAVEKLTPEFAEQVGADPDTQGVIVTQVDRRGAAARLGLQPGDIIAEVNGEEVRQPQELLSAIEDGNGDLRMIVQRGNQLMMLRSSVR